MKQWHKLALIASMVLAISSWVIAIFFWDKLPQIIPTHFGISGMPDDWQNKSILWAFMLPAIQTLMVVMFGFLYWKPQYSDIPTTMWIMTMEKSIKDHAFSMIRTMLAGTSLWIGLLLTYMVYMMNESALNKNIGMNPWLMLVLVGSMLLWLIWWTIKVYRATKEAMATQPKNK